MLHSELAAKQVQNHISACRRNAYTTPLIALAYKVIAELTAQPEQQAKLLSLVVELQGLIAPSEPYFLGSTAA